MAEAPESPLSLGEPAFRPREKPSSLGPSDTYRFMRLMVGVFLIVTLDLTNYLDKGSAARYLVLIVPFGGMFFIRFRTRTSLIRRPLAGDWVLAVLLTFGLLGSVYGRLHLHTVSTALPIFVPMPMAFLYLLTVESPTESEVRKILRAIALVGLLYVVLNAVANSGLAPSLGASRSFRNAKSMYIGLGFTATLMTGRRGRVLLFAVLTGYVFKTYPSATAAMVAMTTLVTLFLTRPSGTSARFYIGGFVVLVVLIVGLFNFSRSVQLANDYFASVGKRNNTNTRLALWKAGIVKFEQSPLFGDAFTGETTVSVSRRSGGGAPFKNPYNDDYILFAASGGLFSLLLLLWWIASTEVIALRRYRGFMGAGQPQHAMLMRALLVGFNAWLTAAAFNPLFQGVARSVTLFALYGLMMSLGRPSPAEAEPAPQRVPAETALRPT